MSDDLCRVIEEIKQTANLSLLLTQAARRDLTPEEKKRVIAQFMDICKTVPTLAIFALPGGGVLLPIFVEALSFNVLPSAFED